MLRAPKQLADAVTRPAISAAPPVASIVDPLLAPARWLDELADMLPTLTPATADDKAALEGFDARWLQLAPQVEMRASFLIGASHSIRCYSVRLHAPQRSSCAPDRFGATGCDSNRRCRSERPPPLSRRRLAHS